MRNLSLILICLTLFGLLTGCSQQPAPMAPVTKIEDKIKSIEQSDLPAPMKVKAIQDLQAKQAAGGATTGQAK